MSGNGLTLQICISKNYFKIRFSYYVILCLLYTNITNIEYQIVKLFVMVDYFLLKVGLLEIQFAVVG